ncbi:hypothetical protein ACJX0J_032898, partial [Zea mays]
RDTLILAHSNIIDATQGTIKVYCLMTWVSDKEIVMGLEEAFKITSIATVEDAANLIDELVAGAAKSDVSVMTVILLCLGTGRLAHAEQEQEQEQEVYSLQFNFFLYRLYLEFHDHCCTLVHRYLKLFRNLYIYMAELDYIVTQYHITRPEMNILAGLEKVRGRWNDLAHGPNIQEGKTQQEGCTQTLKRKKESIGVEGESKYGTYSLKTGIKIMAIIDKYCLLLYPDFLLYTKAYKAACSRQKSISKYILSIATSFIYHYFIDPETIGAHICKRGNTGAINYFIKSWWQHPDFFLFTHPIHHYFYFLSQIIDTTRQHTQGGHGDERVAHQPTPAA